MRLDCNIKFFEVTQSCKGISVFIQILTKLLTATVESITSKTFLTHTNVASNSIDACCIV